jgi:hypothetical protein
MWCLVLVWSCPGRSRWWSGRWLCGGGQEEEELEHVGAEDPVNKAKQRVDDLIIFIWTQDVEILHYGG